MNVLQRMGCRLILLCLCWTISCGPVIGQLPSHPREDPRDEGVYDWYNRKTGITRHLIDAVEGRPDSAILAATDLDGDLEADFVRAVAYAQRGMPDSAAFFVRRSLRAGLPVSRYQAGPDSLFGAWATSEVLQGLIDEFGGDYLVHGPMLGRVNDHRAGLWLRTDSVRRVQWIISVDSNFMTAMRSPAIRTDARREHVAKMDMTGLLPDTRYYYKLEIDGQEFAGPWTFRTAPRVQDKAQISVGFGGGAAFIPWHHAMWETLARQEFDAFLFLGDNVYIDYPERPYIQQYCYYRRHAQPEFRRFIARTPIYAVWDDHDFGDNDAFGTPRVDSPYWKKPVLEVFKNQWINPAYGGDARHPGVWFTFSQADVQFFMLDGRYYREGSFVGDSTGMPKSMLGPAQLAWLKDQLLASDATFKVICSPVPWSFGAKGVMEGRYDTWRGYPEERQEIFDFLTSHAITGVILIAADRHRSDIWRIDRAGDYPLFEFESSKLTNRHTHNIRPGSLFGYNETCSFGKLVFDTQAPDPWVEYQIWNIGGELVHRYRVSLSQLE